MEFANGIEPARWRTIAAAMHRRLTAVLPLALTVVLPGCQKLTDFKDELAAKLDDEAAGEDEQAQQEPPPKYQLKCSDLPGAPRSDLRVAADGKIYYAERRPLASDEDYFRFDIFTFDPATDARTRVVEGASAAVRVLEDGRIVFSRRTGKHEYLDKYFADLLVQTPGEETPKRLNGDKESVGGFEVFEDAGVVVYAGGADTFAMKIMKAPLAGGDAQELGKGYQLDGKLDDGVMVHTGFGRYNKLTLVGGEGEEVFFSNPNYAGIAEGRILEVQAGQYSLGKPKDTAKTPIGEGIARARMVISESGWTLSGIMGDSRAAVIGNGAGGKTALTMTGANPSEVIEHEGALIVLATHDTDGNGVFDFSDESDVCVIRDRVEESTIEIVARTVPKARVEQAAKLAEVATQNSLENPRVRILGESSPFVVIHTTAAGPASDGELREAARTVGKAVNEAFGETVSVSIRYHGSGKRVGWTWDTELEGFFSIVGFGSTGRGDPKEYAVSFDPKLDMRVKNQFGRQSTIGSATCKGTLKNTGAAPLADLQVTCSNKVVTKIEAASGPVTPATLPPGAEGTYSVKLDVADTSRGFPLAFSAGGKRIAALNLYSDDQNSKAIAAYEALYAEGGLAFEQQRVFERGPSYDRKQIREVTLRAPADFAAKAPADQQQAASDARTKLAAHYGQGTIELRVLEPDTERVGWTLLEGQALETAN